MQWLVRIKASNDEADPDKAKLIYCPFQVKTLGEQFVDLGTET